MRKIVGRKKKQLIAIHAETGELEQFTSLGGAVIYMQNLNFTCTTVGITKACNDVKLKYLNRYWSFVE